MIPPAVGLTPHVKTYVLAGGCFWCLDAVYRRLRGVTDVESGYTGGGYPNPDYYTVCNGTTGHAEAVKVTFDETEIPAEVILDVFFATHDPTTLNRQGYDVGTQYRSAMFYTDEEQRQEFVDGIERAQALWHAPIVTEVSRASTWYPAEDVHQDFYSRQPGNGYCQVIINPKLAKTRKYYSQWLAA